MRILVVDGHPAMRLGIKGLLSVAGDMWVVGETGEGDEALSLADEIRPDLVILGLNLVGETDGIEACLRLKALPDPPRVLVHAAYDFTDDVASCLLDAADGYLHKSSCCEELLEAIRRTAEGRRVWASGNAVGEAGSRVCISQAGARLSPKEREVMVLMLRGCCNGEVAQKLYLGLPTVKTHVRSILRKLGAKNRKELFRLATSNL